MGDHRHAIHLLLIHALFSSFSCACTQPPTLGGEQSKEKRKESKSIFPPSAQCSTRQRECWMKMNEWNEFTSESCHETISNVCTTTWELNNFLLSVVLFFFAYSFAFSRETYSVCFVVFFHFSIRLTIPLCSVFSSCVTHSRFVAVTSASLAPP